MFNNCDISFKFTFIRHILIKILVFVHQQESVKRTTVCFGKVSTSLTEIKKT